MTRRSGGASFQNASSTGSVTQDLVDPLIVRTCKLQELPSYENDFLTFHSSPQLPGPVVRCAADEVVLGLHLHRLLLPRHRLLDLQRQPRAHLLVVSVIWWQIV